MVYHDTLNWWRISDSNRSVILGASEETTTSSPIPHKLAGNVGFEPTTHGLTVRCTTTVLIAIKIGPFGENRTPLI